VTLLQSYFFRQILRPLLVTSLILAILALLTQSLSSIDLIIENQASLIAVLKITVLALPQLFAIVLPFAVFIAVGFAVQHLHTDNEVMVSYAAGMTQWQVISPILRLISYAVLINLLLNLFAQPMAFRLMRETIYQVRSDLATAIIRPGEFVSPAANLTIFARDMQNGVMTDVFIHDGRNQEQPMTFFAKSGAFANISKKPSITLNNASRQNLSEDGTLEFLQFSSTSFELNGVIKPQGDLLYKYSDRYISELFNPDPNNFWEMQHADDLRAEGHYRLSSPFYNYTLGLLALLALLSGEFSKLGYGRRLIVFGALALVVRLAGFTLTSAAQEIPTLNVFQYVFPVLISLLCLGALLSGKRKSNKHQLARIS